MAIDSRNEQPVCNTEINKNPNLVTVIASDVRDMGSRLHMASSPQDFSTSFHHKLSAIPMLQDGVPPLYSDDVLCYFRSGQCSLRKCPNSAETDGNDGNCSQTTETYGTRNQYNNQFNLRLSRGHPSGQGNGDDGNDRDKPSDYKKKWLNCDHKLQTPRNLKLKRDALERCLQEEDEVKVPHMENGRRPPVGTDEIDASMVEQETLLFRERTAQECRQDQVIYSTQRGHVVAFMQRRFRLWRGGSFITPGLSEGVIFDRTLTISESGQYRYGEEFVPYAELGQGDFGITRACQDTSTGAKMASKEVPRDRFLPFEVLQLSKIRSPFIVQFLGATAERSSLYIHMELVDNALSLEYIADEGYLLLTGQDVIVKILHQLLGALDCLYKSAVIHRDLTCRNVLLTAAQRVKVIDFNLAVPSPYEQNTMPVGDIHYLAPEVLDDVRQLTCAIDLWSAGVIIISLLRGLPQHDDCEKRAITGFHPLNCVHLSHCHRQLLDILHQVLHPDWRERPKPHDLVNHCVFKDDFRESLEYLPPRPDNGLDSLDWPIWDSESSDDEDTSRKPAPDYTSTSPLLMDQYKPLQNLPPSLPICGGGATTGGPNSISTSHNDGLAKGDSLGARRKDRKKGRIQIAASFKNGRPQSRVDKVTDSSQTDIDYGVHEGAIGDGGGGIGDHNDYSVANDMSLTIQNYATEYSTPDMPQGAVGGTLEHAKRVVQRTIENLDSLADIYQPFDMNEITETRRWERGGGGQGGAVRDHQEPAEMADHVPSQATTSSELKNNLCDGVYGYPEDWLFPTQVQPTADEQSEQSGDARISPLVSTPGSSFRGTNQEEASLEMGILIDQLSLETNPEYQNQLFHQLSSSASSE